MANAMVLGASLAIFATIPFAAESSNPSDFLVVAIPVGCLGVLLVWGILSIMNWSRAKKITSKCTGVERAVQLSFEPNTDYVTLTFANDLYADRFAVMNTGNRTY
jgi:hypothetical protein